MADLVSMRADAAAIRQDMEHILATDGELSVEQVAELDAKREKLEGLQDQVNRAESVSAAKEALARPTFNMKPAANASTVPVERSFNGRTRSELVRDRILAAIRNEPMSERLFDFASAATGATQNAADLLPVDLQDEIIARLLPAVSAVRQAATVRTYSNDVEIPVVSGRVTVTGTAEGAAYNDTTPDFNKLRFRSYKSTAMTRMTEEVVADARGGFIDETLQQHAEGHALYFESLYLSTAAAQNASAPDGMLATEANIASTFPDDAGSAAIFDQTASGDTIAEVTYADLLGVAFGMPAKYWGLPKSWIMSPALYQHILGLTDGTGGAGRPLFLANATGTIQQDAVLGTLFGYPVYVSDQLTDSTPASSFQAVLLERGSYVIADRLGVASTVDNITAADEGLVKFLTRMRSDGRWVRPSSSARLLMAAS